MTCPRPSHLSIACRCRRITRLGPGDELLIRAWGKNRSRCAGNHRPRRTNISTPSGASSVAGLRYSQVDGGPHSEQSARCLNIFDSSCGPRSAAIDSDFRSGSARRPGAYTVGSLSTMVNALFVSGGPAATGSMRHVQLIRNNQVLTEFDIYDLVKRGDKSHDRPLLPGDILFIPPVGPRAAIVGSVEEPGIYELSGSTTVASALQSAGGLTSLAETRRALLERVEEHSRRRVEEFSRYHAGGMQRILKDGDLLQILPVSPEFENTVTLRGNVAQPGRYAWHEGMRFLILIPTRDFLLTREYWNRENHVVSAAGKHQFGDPRLGAAGPAPDKDENGGSDRSPRPMTDGRKNLPIVGRKRRAQGAIETNSTTRIRRIRKIQTGLPLHATTRETRLMAAPGTLQPRGQIH